MLNTGCTELDSVNAISEKMVDACTQKRLVACKIDKKHLLIIESATHNRHTTLYFRSSSRNGDARDVVLEL